MILLASTTTKLQIITSAAGTIHVDTNWVDLLAGAVTPGSTLSVISTAATTDIVAAPAASTVRNVKTLQISNQHATNSNVITLQKTDGTSTVVLESVTLAPGERIGYSEGRGLRVVDARGAERTPLSPITASGAAAGTASGVDTYIAGLPLGGRIQQYTRLEWTVMVSKTAAGIAAPIFTFRTGTAGTVSDTSRVPLTSAKAQTGAIDTGVYDCFAVIRTGGTSGIMVAGYQMSHNLVTTGLSAQAADAQVGVSSAFDITPSNLIVSLSINPGASSVWTFDASVFATNLIGS